MLSGRTLIHAGIDEAGYGPRIGPLAVGLSVFRIRAASRDQTDNSAHAKDTAGVPDLWQLLRGVVGRAADARGPARGAARPIVLVDDSKKLKGVNSLVRRRPLDRLEQSVLAFLRVLGRTPGDDEELFQILAADTDLAPWYLGAPVELPTTTTTGHIGVLAAALAGGLERAGVEPIALRCRLVGEAAFNESVAAHGSKSVINFTSTAEHLRWLWRELGVERPVVSIDRQGGRVCYGAPLARAFPDASIRAIDEAHERSAYDIIESSPRPGGDRRSMRVDFEIGCDSRHLPTALASMVAKLVRELAMSRLNRYWCELIPGLTPTAGYGADANRWLREVDHVLTAADRARLVRNA